jgi:hypothetical protein
MHPSAWHDLDGFSEFFGPVCFKVKHFVHVPTP